MELNLNSSGDDYRLKKHFFNLKTHKNDELILQVFHSYSESSGENKRHRFIHASFNDHGTRMAVVDYKGYIFIIDLETERYWQLPDVGLPTLMSFPISKQQGLLIALDNCLILFVNIENGNVVGVLNGHSVPATEISYSDDGYYYLTSCSAEAIIWDSSTLTQIHRLTLKSDVLLRKALFMPVTNHILACFQDNTMCIWKLKNFQCIKQIIPETWKTHSLKAIAFTKNGRAMVVGGHSPSLVIFSLDTWTVMKAVEFPEHTSGVKQMEFISQVFDGGANKILVVLTTSLEIFFFDIETSVFLRGLPLISGLAVKFSLSSDGKYMATVLTTGEVNVYVIENILSSKKHSTELEEHFTDFAKNSSKLLSFSGNQSNTSRRTIKSVESLGSIQKQIRNLLDVKKLIPILKQFGEYPESYRLLIWKVILQLPGNQESFVSLSMKNCHPSFTKLETKYPLVNKSLCNSLKKSLSSLSYWCPLFGEVDFIPEFTFPFVKLFHLDPLACFEILATIIVNWCQNWFEFYPFPPINMLSAMENILGHHDPSLLEFFFKNNITSSVYVCPLFHTVFSEVLSKSEWLKLWDHILSNEPSFLFMAIIAFNVVCRNAILTFPDSIELEKFFHRQHPVNMKKLISKAYNFLKETPDEIHPRQFFTPFCPLSSGGTYTTFMAYPKLIVDPSSEKLQSIRIEEEKILEEQLTALSITKKLDKKLKVEPNSEGHDKMYQELEEKIRKTVEEEEDRVLFQRQRLQNLRHELRLKELEVLEGVRDNAAKERFRRKQIEFERLLKDISKRRAREKFEVDVIEEETQKYYAELLLRKCQWELELGALNGNENACGDLDKLRQKLSDDLLQLQKEWDSAHHSKRTDLTNRVAAARILYQDLEADVAKEITEKQSREYRAFAKQLKSKVKNLEDEIERLVEENLNKLKKKKRETQTAILEPISRALHSSSPSEDDEKDFVNSPKSEVEESRTHTRGRRKDSKKRKPVGKKTVPTTRKTSAARVKFPQTKSPSEVKHQTYKTGNRKCGSLKDFHSTTKKPKVPRYKSKFTCSPIEFQQSSPDSFGGQKLELDSNESFEMKKPHRQPEGDFVHRKARSKKKPFEYSTKKCLSRIDSDNEIFKSVLRARQQLVEEAKLRHNLE